MDAVNADSPSEVSGGVAPAQIADWNEGGEAPEEEEEGEDDDDYDEEATVSEEGEDENARGTEVDVGGEEDHHEAGAGTDTSDESVSGEERDAESSRMLVDLPLNVEGVGTAKTRELLLLCSKGIDDKAEELLCELAESLGGNCLCAGAVYHKRKGVSVDFDVLKVANKTIDDQETYTFCPTCAASGMCISKNAIRGEREKDTASENKKETYYVMTYLNDQRINWTKLHKSSTDARWSVAQSFRTYIVDQDIPFEKTVMSTKYLTLPGDPIKEDSPILSGEDTKKIKDALNERNRVVLGNLGRVHKGLMLCAGAALHSTRNVSTRKLLLSRAPKASLQFCTTCSKNARCEKRALFIKDVDGTTAAHARFSIGGKHALIPVTPPTRAPKPWRLAKEIQAPTNAAESFEVGPSGHIVMSRENILNNLKK
eukprot:scaffold373865_cov28-Prasinocladus_malaysianus.AAC.1